MKMGAERQCDVACLGRTPRGPSDEVHAAMIVEQEQLFEAPTVQC